MTGQIVKVNGVLYLQVEGGGSWSLNSIPKIAETPQGVQPGCLLVAEDGRHTPTQRF